MRDYKIKRILIDKNVRDNPLVKRIIKKAGEVEVKEVLLNRKKYSVATSFTEGKRSILLTDFPGKEAELQWGLLCLF